MKDDYLILILAVLLTLMGALIVYDAHTAVKPFNNCSQLSNPKTVLLVCMPHCPSCEDFMPVYQQVSNQRKDYMFYKANLTNSMIICGHKIVGFPTTLRDNKSYTGYMTINELNKFLR